jgi:sodium/pantothenate symporter
MPLFIGVVMLTGILSAGVSSASTFLSLIGSSLTNDILDSKKTDDVKKNLEISRIGMAVVSIVVLVLAFFNPPQIFWIMYFGGTVIASAWGVVALTSVWSRKMSESAAFWGMLLGFLGCVVPKTYSALSGVALPIYLDPFFIGVLMSIIGILIGNRMESANAAQIAEYDKLHIRPASEKNPAEDRKTFRLAFIYVVFGLLLGLFFVLYYAIPYMRAVG